MATYLISYDLIGPNRDYKAVAEHIRSTYGTRAKPLESVWLVVSDKSAGEIRDALQEHIDDNDMILVVRVAKGWGTRKIPKATNDWMRRHI